MDFLRKIVTAGALVAGMTLVAVPAASADTATATARDGDNPVVQGVVDLASGAGLVAGALGTIVADGGKWLGGALKQGGAGLPAVAPVFLGGLFTILGG